MNAKLSLCIVSHTHKHQGHTYVFTFLSRSNSLETSSILSLGFAVAAPLSSVSQLANLPVKDFSSLWFLSHLLKSLIQPCVMMHHCFKVLTVPFCSLFPKICSPRFWKRQLKHCYLTFMLSGHFQEALTFNFNFYSTNPASSTGQMYPVSDQWCDLHGGVDRATADYLEKG